MPAPSEQLVLKEGDVFLLTDQTGDVVGNTGFGLYYHDTRYLSLYSFKVNGNSPSLLNFSARRTSWVPSSSRTTFFTFPTARWFFRRR